MIITAKQGTSELVLCHGATRAYGKTSGPVELMFVPDGGAPQIAPLLRASRAAIYDRGNEVDRWTFAALHREVSNPAAQQWLVEHRAAIPRNVSGSAAVSVEFRWGNVLATLAGAVIRLAEARAIGCSVQLKYEIVGTLTSLTPIGG